MCNCKDCKGITLLKGTDGVSIVSITDNGNGTFTILLSNGNTFVSPNYTGPEGEQGIQGIPGPAGANGTNGINGNWSIVEYLTDPLGANTSGAEPAFSFLDPFVFTVPVLTPAAEYEITFHATIVMANFDETIQHGVFVDIYKNGAQINTACVKGVRAVTVGSLPLAFNVTTSIIVNLAAGDDVTIFSTSSSPADAYLIGGIFKVVKIG